MGGKKTNDKLKYIFNFRRKVLLNEGQTSEVLCTSNAKQNLVEKKCAELAENCSSFDL